MSEAIINYGSLPTPVISSCKHYKRKYPVFKTWDFDIVDGVDSTNKVKILKAQLSSTQNESLLDNHTTHADMWRSIINILRLIYRPIGGWRRFFYGNDLTGNQPVYIINTYRKLIGEGIKPNSITIRASEESVLIKDYYVDNDLGVNNYYKIGELIDKNDNNRKIGFVLYDTGLICLTDANLITANPDILYDNTNIEFKSTKSIFINSVDVNIQPNNYAYSTNPTFYETTSETELTYKFEITKSGSLYLINNTDNINLPLNTLPDGSILKRSEVNKKQIDKKLIISQPTTTQIDFNNARNERQDEGTNYYVTVSGSINMSENPNENILNVYEDEDISDFFIAGSFEVTSKIVSEQLSTNTPNKLKFITSVGLYNDHGDMIAVAKPANPIPLYEDIDLNFNIKFDTDA